MKLAKSEPVTRTGDELIVAGKAKGKAFEVMAYRNLTKNISSYRNGNCPIIPIFAGPLLLVGVGGLMANLFFHDRLMLPLSIMSATFFGCGLYFLYLLRNFREADRLVENYK